jgi:hypothetical protein
MTTYLLPCECTADVAVTAGQAGGRVTCPQCGREVIVPKLGDLARVRRKEVAEHARTVAWRPAQAVAFLGAIVAAGSLAGALWFAPGTAGVIDEQALRAAVLTVDESTAYRVWSEVLARANVRRPPSEEELALLRRMRFADGVRGVLALVAAGGALAALAAGVRLMMDTKLQGVETQPGEAARRAGASRS